MKRLILVVLVLAALDGAKGNGYCKPNKCLSQRPHSVSILEFGAVGDGVTLNSVAFQNAIFYLRSFADKGGAQLYVPRGRWLTGSFNLTSHLTLYLEKDAVILASKDVSQWPVVEPLPSYGRGLDLPGPRYQSLINGYNLVDVAITGEKGIINGEGSVWWESFTSRSLKYSRPHLLELVNCTDIVIANLTFLDSPAWSIHPVYCSNLHIHNVTVRSSSVALTDGIVPDSCSEMCIMNCHISVGQDAIAFKSGWDEYGISYGKPSSNIYIGNVDLQTSSGAALAFGSEMSGGISNVHVEHVNIHGSLRGIELRTISGRGGFIKDVMVSDVTMVNVGKAIRFTGHSGKHPDEGYDPKALPFIDRITLKNIVGKNITVAGTLMGIENDPFTSICLSNITLSVSSDPATSWTCSNVSGFTDFVLPEPCPDLSPHINSSSCFALENYSLGIASA